MKVALYGVGAIGAGLGGELARRGCEIVGAIDTDPAKIGRRLSRFIDSPEPLNQIITRTSSDVLGHDPDIVVVHATSSRLIAVVEQLEEIIRCGHAIVSTCEELAFPAATDAVLTRRLNTLAEQHGASVIAAGINPGFLMDFLPAVLALPCVSVSHVQVLRAVDTNRRRLPLQRKVGVGISVEEFEQRASQAAVGHVGLRQSAHLLADGLGWSLTGYHETLTPVTADHDIETGLGTVARGMVIGQRQVGTGSINDRDVIRLELQMAAGVSSEDRVLIEGEPTVTQTIKHGVNGDIGTVGMVANLVEAALTRPAGLLTMSRLLRNGFGGHVDPSQRSRRGRLRDERIFVPTESS